MNISLQPLFLPFRKNHWLQIGLILLLVLGLFYLFASPVFAADAADSSNGVTPDTVKSIKSAGFFSGILTYFEDALKHAGKRLQPFALTLGSFLMMIQIGTTWTLYEGQLRMFELIKEIISFSFILFLILNFDTLADTFIQGWQFFGGTASGLFVTGTPVEAITNNPAYSPSGLIDSGWAVVGNVITSALSIAHPIDSLFILICGMGAYLGLVFMALQVTITLIEYYMVTSLGVILLPFGMLRYTKFLYSQLVKGFFTFGIKLMTVYFICGLAGNVMTDLGKIMKANNVQRDAEAISRASHGILNPEAIQPILDPSYFQGKVNYGDVLNFMLFYIIMGYLVWKIPNLVSSMVSGSPQMDAGSTLRSAMGGVGMVAAGMAGTAHLAGNVVGTWKATGAADGSGGGGGGGSSAVQAATSVSTGTPGGGGIPLSPEGPTIQANGMNVNAKDISDQGNFDLASRVAADTTGGAGGDSDSSPSESAESAASSKNGSDSSPSASAESVASSKDGSDSSPSKSAESAASSEDGKFNPWNESEKAAKQAKEGNGAAATSAVAEAAPRNSQSAPSTSWARRAAPSSPEERAKSSHLGRFARAMVLQGLAGSSLVKHFQHGLQESAYNASVADQMHNNLHQYLTNPQGYRFHDDGGDV